MNMLDDMRDRLADLEQHMGEQMDKLRGKYGDDVVSGMSDTFLTEEESAGLMTDEDKLKALADKFLDENGAIKDDYEHLDEAQYIRDWNESQKIKQTLEKYDGKLYFDDQDTREVANAARSLGLARQEDMYLQSNNSELKETVEKVMNENREIHAEHDNGTSPIVFGR